MSDNCPLCGETKKRERVWSCGTWKRTEGHHQGEACEIRCADVKIEKLEAENAKLKEELDEAVRISLHWQKSYSRTIKQNLNFKKVLKELEDE